MSKVKVLVVDDEESLCRAMQFNLEDTGKYTVCTETSSIKAFDAAIEFKPDIVIMDVIMPEMSGVEVELQFQKDSSTREIPIVFLTAMVSEDQSEMRVISKPVSTERLIEVIESTLDRKKN